MGLRLCSICSKSPSARRNSHLFRHPVNSSHDVSLEEAPDPNRGETLDGYETYRIIGERQTLSGLQDEVSVEKIL
jgi:hypothetical protein